MSLLCYLVFLLYKLLNMFRATMCPSSGADDCVVLSPHVGIVPCLQEGCQNQLAAGSVSIEEFVARRDNTTQSSAPVDGHMVARNMLSNFKGEIKGNTKVTTSWLLIHT